jgi:hypothetical protein
MTIEEQILADLANITPVEYAFPWDDQGGNAETMSPATSRELTPNRT